MEDALIAAVYEREPLWNPASDLHKNAVVLKKIWEEVAMELQKDVKTVKARWKNMRAYFFKEHQKLKKQRNLDGSEKVNSTWQYYDQLLFLKSETPDSTDEASTDDVNQSNLVSDNTGSFQSQSKPMWTYSHRRSENHNKLYQIKKKRLVIVDRESVKEKNDDLLFFESLLPYMDNISMMRKLRLRSEIQNLILAELEAENDIQHEVPVIP